MFYVCDGRRHLLRRASMAAPKDGGRAAAGAAGGGGQPKMAAEARRRPLGRNGVVSPGGAVPRRGWGGAGSGQRTSRRLVDRRPRPAGSSRGLGARGAERALVGRADLAPQAGRASLHRFSPAFL